MILIKIKNTIVEFVKKETVLVVAFVLALVSAFFNPPSIEYLDYIDFRVLGVLLSLMIVMSALRRVGVFDKIGEMLLQRTKTVRQLCIVLVMLCFFSSMFITNDVALITFVPFAILTLNKAQRQDKLIFVLVMQTIGANLGSMLTPMGNPQNLYLYNLSGMSFGDFIVFMLPYSFVAFLLICIIMMFCPNNKIDTELINESPKDKTEKKTIILTVIYSILFILGILSVCRILPYYILLAVVVLAVAFCDVKTFVNVDYCLIFTFIFFFVFIGNISNIGAVRTFLENMVSGNEIIVGITASQVISNVPASLMLSGFTKDYNSLLIGVNIGGLGTLIASMASLISYKMYAHNYNETKGKYLLWFTLANLLFLVVMCLTVFIIGLV